MLIRRYFRPTRWLWVLPVAFLVLLAYGSWVWFHPEGLTGGSTAGIWFGLLGWACLLWTFIMLPWQRRPSILGRRGKPRSYWLQGHLWVALLGTLLILCHTGMCQNFTRLGGRLETVLMVVLGLTLLTGFVGMGLQGWLPQRLTAESAEIPAGQIMQVCQVCARRPTPWWRRCVPWSGTRERKSCGGLTGNRCAFCFKRITPGDQLLLIPGKTGLGL